MKVDESNPSGLNQLIRRAQANQFKYAADKHMERQKRLFRRKKMNLSTKEFDKIPIADFGIRNINNLIKDIRIGDINATFAFANELEEINFKIDELAKKQCKTDRCVEWVLCHAKY